MGSAEGKLSKSESSDIMTTDAGESTEIDEKTDKEDFTVKYDSKTKKWSARYVLFFFFCFLTVLVIFNVFIVS